MESAILAWSILIVGFVLPMAHICVAKNAGPWRMPAGSRCPFSPRIGWLVIVMFLGPIGWIMFVTRKSKT